MYFLPYDSTVSPVWRIITNFAFLWQALYAVAIRSFSSASATNIVSNYLSSSATSLVDSTRNVVLCDITNWIAEMRRTEISWGALVQMVLGYRDSRFTVDSSSCAVCSLDAPDAMKEMSARGVNIITCERKPSLHRGNLGPESELVDLAIHAYMRQFIQNPVAPGSVTIHLMTSDGNDKNPGNSNLPDLVMLAACAGYRINVVGLNPNAGFSVVQSLFPKGMVTVTRLGECYGYGKQSVTQFTGASVHALRFLMAEHAKPLPPYCMDVEDSMPVYAPKILAFAPTCMDDGRIEEYQRQLMELHGIGR
jgi:hypothetical protein